MMESLTREEQKVIKDVKNIFRLEKETRAIKGRILRNIKNIFEHENKKIYYKPVRINNC